MAEQVQSECHPKGGKTVLSPLRGSEMGDALLAGVSLRYTPACALVTPSGFWNGLCLVCRGFAALHPCLCSCHPFGVLEWVMSCLQGFRCATPLPVLLSPLRGLCFASDILPHRHKPRRG